MAVDLPPGLRGAWETLSYASDRHKAFERLTTLVWLRLVADPDAPTVAGFDPRTIVEPKVEWPLPAEARLLNAGAVIFNHMLGDQLLSIDWDELSQPTLERAVSEVIRWQPSSMPGPDYIGEISQRVRRNEALGEYYTPYEISLLMAAMTGVEPGFRVLDPCCGSGRMLLAAIEVCRNAHDGKIPEVAGIDISPDAVRMCRMNLALAGVHPAQRVECKDFLLSIPFEQCTPIQKAMQLELYKYEAGEMVAWRKLAA